MRSYLEALPPDCYSKVEVIGDCLLLQADCLKVLPNLPKVDACLTDPPYGIGAAKDLRGGKKHGKAISASKSYGSSNWDDNPIGEKEISAIMAVSTWQIIFGGNYFPLPPTQCWFVWDKVTGNNGYADFEMAWTNLKKACRMIEWQWKGMLQQDMKNKEERFHPTQKPVEVMSWCIKHLPNNTQTILDPFMGSGTTGVACAKMGRKFIGIELEPKYFDIACKRIEEAYKQPDMFVQRPAAMEQEGLGL